jgi:flagellar basal-body M-ring protein/flagellar hook-basal body protein fliF
VSDTLRQLLAHGPGFLGGMSRGQQVLLLALAVLIPVLVLAGSHWLADGQYVPLFASLTAEEAGAIVAQLKTAKTPYRIGGSGEQILVPADKVGEVRLRIAAQGLPLGGGVGFEVFDKAAFGLSDFSQRLNYQRALQGELARTIGQLPGIVRARVHLVLPQQSLFSDRDRPASASVFLRLAPGRSVGGEQVRSIVHLVASSVEGLTPDRVTVVDTAGRVLAVGGESAGAAALSPRRLEAKTAAEEGLERRVQSLLDQVLGPGQAVTRVAVQMSFDQVERTEERFDPKPVPRQQSKTVESTKGRTSTPPAVAPGSADRPESANAVTSNEGSRQSETTSYELSKVVARTLSTPGEIQRVSVAVLLNAPGKAARETRDGTARSPEELEKIRKVVMGAARPVPWKDPLVVGGAAAGTLALGAVSGLVWLVRRRARRRAPSLEQVVRGLGAQEAAAAFAPGAGALPEVEPAPADAVPGSVSRAFRDREELRRRAVGFATAEPEASAQLIRAWMVKRRTLATVGEDRNGQ